MFLFIIPFLCSVIYVHVALRFQLTHRAHISFAKHAGKGK